MVSVDVKHHVYLLTGKLQALVYDIFPSATAVIDCAIMIQVSHCFVLFFMMLLLLLLLLFWCTQCIKRVFVFVVFYNRPRCWRQHRHIKPESTGGCVKLKPAYEDNYSPQNSVRNCLAFLQPKQYRRKEDRRHVPVRFGSPNLSPKILNSNRGLL